MLENIKYTNHLGETVYFNGAQNIFARHGELRDYSWNYDVNNDVISGFNHRKISQKSLPIRVHGTSEQCQIARNRLYEVIDKDTIATQPGKLWFDDYYLRCFISASKKSRYMPNGGDMELTVITDNSYWVKPTTYKFGPQNITFGLKYNKSYRYRYTDYATNVKITNSNIAAMPFKLMIYGPCVDPEIFIGTQPYKINIELQASESVELTAIDQEKTIIKTDASGEKTNVFNSREKSYDNFAPIPNGSFTVTWDGSFNFDLTVYDRRSEPIWN